MNDAQKYLELAFDRADELNTLWNIDIAVALGLLGIMASAKPFTQSKLVRTVLAIGFAIFAVSNLVAMLDINSQRVALLALVSQDASLSAVAAVSGPESKCVLTTFYICVNIPVVALIWALPRFVSAETTSAT